MSVSPTLERYRMRLNGKKIVEVMRAKSLTEETVCSRTGPHQKSFRWIVKEGFASEDAVERISDAIGGNGLLKRGEDRENRPLYFGECRGGILVRFGSVCLLPGI